MLPAFRNGFLAALAPCRFSQAAPFFLQQASPPPPPRWLPRGLPRARRYPRRGRCRREGAKQSRGRRDTKPQPRKSANPKQNHGTSTDSRFLGLFWTGSHAGCCSSRPRSGAGRRRGLGGSAARRRAGMAAAAAPSSARPAPGRGEPCGGRDRSPGRSSELAVTLPGLRRGGRRAPRRALLGPSTVFSRQQFWEKNTVHPQNRKEPKRKGRPSPLARRPICSLSPASHCRGYFFPKQDVGPGRGNINRCILWELAVRFCRAQALPWNAKIREVWEQGNRSSRRKTLPPRKGVNPEPLLTVALFPPLLWGSRGHKVEVERWEKTFKQSWYWPVARIKLEMVLSVALLPLINVQY